MFLTYSVEIIEVVRSKGRWYFFAQCLVPQLLVVFRWPGVSGVSKGRKERPDTQRHWLVWVTCVCSETCFCLGFGEIPLMLMQLMSSVWGGDQRRHVVLAAQTLTSFLHWNFTNIPEVYKMAVCLLLCAAVRSSQQWAAEPSWISDS